MTKAHAIDLLMTHKGEVLAATGWEGYLACGPGFLVADAHNVGYLPKCLAQHFPPAIRKRLQRLVKSYRPETEVVVMLVYPVEGTVLLALGKRKPLLPPEEALLKWAGRPGLPPMETALFPVAEDRAA
jgi:hypothetical protein